MSELKVKKVQDLTILEQGLADMDYASGNKRLCYWKVWFKGVSLKYHCFHETSSKCWCKYWCRGGLQSAQYLSHITKLRQKLVVVAALCGFDALLKMPHQSLYLVFSYADLPFYLTFQICPCKQNVSICSWLLLWNTVRDSLLFNVCILMPLFCKSVQVNLLVLFYSAAHWFWSFR